MWINPAIWQSQLQWSKKGCVFSANQMDRRIYVIYNLQKNVLTVCGNYTIIIENMTIGTE